NRHRRPGSRNGGRGNRSRRPDTGPPGPRAGACPRPKEEYRAAGGAAGRGGGQMSMSGDEHAADRSAAHGPEPTAPVAGGPAAAGGTGPASGVDDAARQNGSGGPSDGGGSGGPATRTGGMRLQRVWTTPGVHPYDEVTWERRDVVMTNWRDGSVNFEQRGVEFPDFWSVNASNIVTSKYFRGALGSPQREWSLKQLIDRVVTTYRTAGERHGYFATTEDAEIFAHELTYLLLHQYFSFNSPVWFNVGTSSPQQVSACFIL